MREEFKRRQQYVIVVALRQTNGKIYDPGGAAELLRYKADDPLAANHGLAPEAKDSDLTAPPVTGDGECGSTIVKRSLAQLFEGRRL
jgi:hypothetical protein